ncbi:Uncharacterised protein [uncultured archaeon]|nr:Uncharacterised protein [uncultured archaeon]
MKSKIFDIYAFADYSGSKYKNVQKKSIALSIICNDNEKPRTTKCYTRESLSFEILSLLVNATHNDQRVIFGFDHSYSFPDGFYQVVTETRWITWGQLLDLLCYGTKELPPVNDKPREWALAANDFICKRLNIKAGGPFWGPNFKYQVTNPKFFEKTTRLKEKRLTERRCPKTKPIYKIGGIGTVGLQSLYGIQHLTKLLYDLKDRGIELFCWPFDGWDFPSSGHLLVEMYPALVNEKEKTDEQDAEACSTWLYRQDKANTLIPWLYPNLRDDELKMARLEGWILGVP